MKKSMDTTEMEKGKARIIFKIIEYLPYAVVSKTIIRKITGNVTASSFDAGEELAEKPSLAILIFKSLMVLPKSSLRKDASSSQIR